MYLAPPQPPVVMGRIVMPTLTQLERFERNLQRLLDMMERIEQKLDRLEQRMGRKAFEQL